MKPLLTLLTLLTLAHAQIPDEYWLWAKRAGGSSDDRGNSIAVDNNGNVYVTGYFRNTADFGQFSLSSSGSADIFVAKMDSDGNWVWAERAGGSDFDIGYSIAVDNNGNVYVTGYFSNTADFGQFSLSSSGDDDIFVAKMDSDGNWLWAERAGGSDHDYGYSIAVDNSGNVYLTGSFEGTATFGQFSLSSSGYYDIFVAKMDFNGNWLWAKRAGGSSSTYSDVGYSIAVDNNGNVYVTGVFSGTADFGQFSLSSSGYYDIFVAKMDSDGNWLWAEQVVGVNANTDIGYSIAVDNNGNVYVTGYFSSTADFGQFRLSSSGYYDIFVAKMDSDGNWLWAERAGGSDFDIGYSIAVDNNGNVYVTGFFRGIADFGQFSLSGSGYNDIFIAKMDSDGNWLWAERAGGSSSDNVGYSIAVDNIGNVYVTGSFQGTGDFGQFSLSSSGSADIFVAKLSSEGINDCMYYSAIEGAGYLEVRGYLFDIYVNEVLAYSLDSDVFINTIYIDSIAFFDTYGLLADSLYNEGRLFGPLLADLPNDSATIKLVWNDAVLYSITYRAIDYPATAGLGPSLEKADSGWGPSFGNGTPGRENGNGRISLPQDADPFYLNLLPYFNNPVSGGDVEFTVIPDLEIVVYPSIINDSILVITPLWHGNDHLTITAYYEDGTQQERRMLVSLNNVFLDVPTQTTVFAISDTLDLNSWYSRTPQDGVFSFSVSSSDSTIVAPSIVQDTLLVLTNHWYGEAQIELTITSNNDGSYTQSFMVNVANPFIAVPDQMIVNDTSQTHNLIQWFPHPVSGDVSLSVSSSNTDIVQTTLVQDTLIQLDVLNDASSIYGFTDVIIWANYPFSHSASDTFVLTHSPGNQLVINEIHYNPAGSQGSDSEFEFIELANTSNHTIRLENTLLSNEINFGFSETNAVLPDSFVVVARDRDALLAWYPNLNSDIVFEGFTEFMGNTSGTLQLTFNGYALDSLTYSDTDPWPSGADGLGSSLELVNPLLDNSDANSWRASLGEGGTPGFENSTFGYVPQWTQLPPLMMTEDGDTSIAISFWFDFVTDEGVPDSLLNFSFVNTAYINAVVMGDSAYFSIEENWNGETEISIRANNGTNYTDATIQMIVSPVNDAPVIATVSDTSFSEDGNLTFVLTSMDIDSDNMAYSVWSDTTAILVSVTGSLISFSSTLNWTGSGIITAAVSDGEYADSTAFTISIVPVNDAPVMSAIDDYSFPEDSSLVIVLNSSDIENDEVTYTVFSDTSAILIMVEDSLLSLTAENDWNGVTEITAGVSDGEFADSTTFLLTILPLNDFPIMLQSLPDVSINEDAFGVEIIDRLENYFGDVDFGDNLSFSTELMGVGLDSVVFVFEQDTTRLLAYTVENFVGSLDIAITATDDSMATVSDTFLVEILNVNDPPIITVQQTAVTNEETPIAIPFSVFDEEGANVFMSSFVDTSSISLTTTDTNLVITPDLNWFGEANVFLTANDGDTTVTDTILLTVANVNDAPVLSSEFSDNILSNIVSIPLFVQEVDGDEIQANGAFRLSQSDSWQMMNVNTDTSYAGNVAFSVEWESLNKTGNQINWAYSETAECSLWVNDGLVNSNALVFDSLTIANIAGDYNLDAKINAGDIGQLVGAFYQEGAGILDIDIGPSTGTAPFVTTVQDSVIDFEDLATFTQSWYWGAENLPGTNRILLAKSIQNDGDGIFTLRAKSNRILSLNISELLTEGFDLFIQYDTTEIQFETIQRKISNSAISMSSHIPEMGYFSLSSFSKNGMMDFSGNLVEIVVSSGLANAVEIIVGIKRYENSSDDSPFVYSRKTLEWVDLLPKEFALHQNYPNPFNPTTTLRYDLPEDSKVSLIIYDIMGREVVQLINQTQKAGFKSVLWNGKNNHDSEVSAGMYLYRISAGNFHSVKKMVLLK